MKKSVLILTLFFLATSTANAYDFGAAGIVAGLAGAGIALGLVFGAIPAAATVAIGAAVVGISLDPNESTGSTISAQIAPAGALVTPAGWSSPTSPPASTDLVSVNKWTMQGEVDPYNATLGYQDSSEAAANYACTTFYGSSVATFNMNSYGNSATYTCSGGGGSSTNLVTQTNCPTGYSASGGSCVLTTPQDVMKPTDGTCGIKRVGNTFSEDDQDPDCATKPATVDVQPNQISQVKPDGSTKTVTINTDGTTTVTETRPNTTTNTTETNTTHLSAPDASGNVTVTGQSSGATNGTGTGNTGNPVPTFDKTGLATESTLAGIKADTGAIKDALSGEGADSTLSAEKSAFGTALDGLIGGFEDEPGKSEGTLSEGFNFGGYLPAQCGCTPLTMEIMGHTRSYDWCAPMETIKSALAWVLGMFTAWYCLMLFRVGGSK